MMRSKRPSAALDDVDVSVGQRIEGARVDGGARVCSHRMSRTSQPGPRRELLGRVERERAVSRRQHPRSPERRGDFRRRPALAVFEHDPSRWSHERRGAGDNRGQFLDLVRRIQEDHIKPLVHLGQRLAGALRAAAVQRDREIAADDNTRVRGATGGDVLAAALSAPPDRARRTSRARAPRLSASSPSAPVPANASRTRAPSTRRPEHVEQRLAQAVGRRPHARAARSVAGAGHETFQR